MNVIARLEYELAYYDSAVHRFNHYTTRTPVDMMTWWWWWWCQEHQRQLVMTITFMSFTGVGVSASLRRSGGLFIVFWPILTILLFGCSRLVLLFLTLPAALPDFWGSLQVHQLQLVSLSPSWATAKFFSSLARFKYLSIFSFYLIFNLWSTEPAKPTIG